MKICRPEKNFSQKSDLAMSCALLIRQASLCKKLEKTNEEISAYSAGNDFFPEIGLRHILGIAILHLCAKNQQKLMSQSREKLVTDGGANGQRLIYTRNLTKNCLYKLFMN